MRTMTVSLRGLVRASHPGPTLVVTALATGLAVGTGSTPRTSLLVAGAVLTGQLSVGWSNDWLDAVRDRAVGRSGKPVVSGLVSAAALRAGAVVALVPCAALSLATGVVPGVVHLVAVASAWSYNVRLKSTAASWVPYAVSFSLLLLFVVLAQPGRAGPAWWGLLAAALLGVGAHLANVLPDLDDDDATGVRGLAHRLGHARATRVGLATLVTAAALVVLGPPGRPAGRAIVGGSLAAALACAAAAVALRRPRSPWPFRLSMAVAAVCVVLLVAAGPSLVAGSRGPASSPTAARSGCVTTYTPRALPTWANAGFTPPTTPMPYVLSDDGDIVAILWAVHDPLVSPPAADQNNKILWVPRVSSPAGAPLLIRASLRGTGQTVTRTVEGGPGPSIIDMPTAGCWSFDLTWGVHHDHLELEYASR